MASTHDPDNPLPLNVVPMVDVIFCLCVFFLLGFRARERESHLESWLPRERGLGTNPAPEPLSELRVLLDWDPASGLVSRRFQHRALADRAELSRVLREARDQQADRSSLAGPLILDAAPAVPWAAAVEVLDLGRELGLAEIQFALGPGEGH